VLKFNLEGVGVLQLRLQEQAGVNLWERPPANDRIRKESEVERVYFLKLYTSCMLGLLQWEVGKLGSCTTTNVECSFSESGRSSYGNQQARTLIVVRS
jgi:hypothetical protein